MEERKEVLNKLVLQNIDTIKHVFYDVLADSQTIVRLISWELLSKEFPHEVIKNVNRFLISLMDCTHNLPNSLREIENKQNEKHTIDTIVFELTAFTLLKDRIADLEGLNSKTKILLIISQIEKRFKEGLELKQECGLIGDYYYGRIFRGKGEKLVLNIPEADLEIHHCLDKVEVFIDFNFIPLLNAKLSIVSGHYGRVPKNSLTMLEV